MQTAWKPRSPRMRHRWDIKPWKEDLRIVLWPWPGGLSTVLWPWAGGLSTHHTNPGGESATKGKVDISNTQSFIKKNFIWKKTTSVTDRKKIFANTLNSKGLTSISTDSKNQWEEDAQTQQDDRQGIWTINRSIKWPINIWIDSPQSNWRNAN